MRGELMAHRPRRTPGSPKSTIRTFCYLPVRCHTFGRAEVQSALAIYRWLRQRRARAEDLGGLGGRFALADVMRSTPEAESAAGSPVAVLPVRLWQDGVLLFAASTPTDPDRHL